MEDPEDVQWSMAPEVEVEDRTRALHIANFVRPFTEIAAREMLKEYGTIEDMWMPMRKTHCYVLFENREDAYKAYLETYNVVWPRHGNRLVPRFVSEAEAKQAIEDGRNQSSDTFMSTSTSCLDSCPVLTTNPVQPPAAKKTGTLEDFFFKTTTQPPIFYRPLTDAEVEERKRATTGGGKILK